MFILLFGKPGSGKSTAGSYLSSVFNIPRYATGDILRKRAEIDENLAIKMKSGELIHDDILNPIVIDVLKENKNGIILDGYPRNLTQCQFLLKQEYKPAWLIHLEVPDSIAIQRMTNRERNDDKTNIILKRLDVYQKQTVPVIKEFNKHTSVSIIDANDTIEHVNQKIMDEWNKICDSLDLNVSSER